MRLDTPSGRIGLSLSGRGNLANGFNGTVAAIASTLRFGDCRIDRAVSVLRIRVADRKPSVQGPLRASGLSCPGVGMIRPQTLVDATLGEALDNWRGNARLNMPQVRAGDARMANLTGTILFDGNAALTRGTADLDGNSAAFGDSRSGPASLHGRYAFSANDGSFSLKGDAAARNVSLGNDLLRSATAPARRRGRNAARPDRRRPCRCGASGRQQPRSRRLAGLRHRRRRRRPRRKPQRHQRQRRPPHHRRRRGAHLLCRARRDAARRRFRLVGRRLPRRRRLRSARPRRTARGAAAPASRRSPPAMPASRSARSGSAR